MKIYDCFPFCYELPVLELRLNILNDLVDYFVITESEETFTGLPKAKIFLENISRFEKFKDKIIYCQSPVVSNQNIGHVWWEREFFHKNNFYTGLTQAQDNDLLIIGDVDEIVSPETLKPLLENIKEPHVALNKMSVFKLNMMLFNNEQTEQNRIEGNPPVDAKNGNYYQWFGSVVMQKKFLTSHQMFFGHHGYRTQRGKMPQIQNCGWHYTYLYEDVSTIMQKNRAFSHADTLGTQQINNKEYIEDCIRNSHEFTDCQRDLKKISLDNSNCHSYILNHLDKYRNLIS